MTARAALDAARAVFAPSRGPTVGDVTTAPQWVPRDPALHTALDRGERMWAATVEVLQGTTSGSELTGQALVGEARRRELLTLSDAHALIALYGWVERLRDSAPVDAPSAAEREVAREAWMALEHAVETAEMRGAETRFSATRAPATSGGPARSSVDGYTAPSNSPGNSTGNSPGATSFAPNAPGSPPQPPPASPARAATSGGATARTAAELGTSVITNTRGRLAAFLGLATLVSVVATVGVWYARRAQGSGDFVEGVAAYERGAREVARMNFARVAQRDPRDERPLVYLGRIAREEGDLARAKRFLESAVRVEPASALANRELAATLLADGQPELARRFYVRALEQDPNDRLAQGFLGCALLRLGRVEEASRWFDRAGVGDWTACLASPPAAPQP